MPWQPFDQAEHEAADMAPKSNPCRRSPPPAKNPITNEDPRAGHLNTGAASTPPERQSGRRFRRYQTMSGNVMPRAAPI